MNKAICLLSLVLLLAACRKNSDLIIQELPTLPFSGEGSLIVKQVLPVMHI
jgi:hypothetical protein